MPDSLVMVVAKASPPSCKAVGSREGVSGASAADGRPANEHSAASALSSADRSGATRPSRS